MFHIIIIPFIFVKVQPDNIKKTNKQTNKKNNKQINNENIFGDILTKNYNASRGA